SPRAITTSCCAASRPRRVNSAGAMTNAESASAIVGTARNSQAVASAKTVRAWLRGNSPGRQTLMVEWLRRQEVRGGGIRHAHTPRNHREQSSPSGAREARNEGGRDKEKEDGRRRKGTGRHHSRALYHFASSLHTSSFSSLLTRRFSLCIAIDRFRACGWVPRARKASVRKKIAPTSSWWSRTMRPTASLLVLLAPVSLTPPADIARDSVDLVEI